MRLTVRHRIKTDLDHELIWLSVSLGGLALAASWFALRLPWPHCIFLSITGHPCLTCGATRAAIAFFHLDFWSAWKWNPLVFLFLSGLSIFDVYAFAVFFLLAPRLRICQFSVVYKRVFRFADVVSLLSHCLF